jgi:hypothetical protein
VLNERKTNKRNYIPKKMSSQNTPPWILGELPYEEIYAKSNPTESIKNCLASNMYTHALHLAKSKFTPITFEVLIQSAAFYSEIWSEKLCIESEKNIGINLAFPIFSRYRLFNGGCMLIDAVTNTFELKYLTNKQRKKENIHLCGKILYSGSSHTFAPSHDDKEYTMEIFAPEIMRDKIPQLKYNITITKQSSIADYDSNNPNDNPDFWK